MTDASSSPTNDELAQSLLAELQATGAPLDLSLSQNESANTCFSGRTQDASSSFFSSREQTQETHRADDKGDNPFADTDEADFFAAINAFRAARDAGNAEQMRVAESRLQQVVRAELRGEDTHGA